MSSASIKIPMPKAEERNEENHLQHSESTVELREDSKRNITKDSENENAPNANVVINIDETVQENMKSGYSNKNYLVYSHSVGEKPRRQVPPSAPNHISNRNHSSRSSFRHMPNTMEAEERRRRRSSRMAIEPTGETFEYTSDRNDFVRLVLLLVFIMLATTAVCISIVFMNDDLKEFCQSKGLLIGIAGAAISISMTYVVMCSSCSRIFPCNIICLFITVIGQSLVCIFVTVRYSTEIVLMAVAATAGVILVCFFISLSKFDFTSYMLYIMTISSAFSIVFLIVVIYMVVTGTYMKWVHFVILLVSTCISSVILVMELQMILGGRTVELGEEDYALGAFMVYTSIIDIFLKMVQMLGILDSDD